MSAHLDSMTGDCEEMQAPCPLTKIGCSETKVCLCTFILIRQLNKGLRDGPEPSHLIIVNVRPASLKLSFRLLK